METEQQSQEEKKPQPIIIPSINNIQKMFEILNEVAKDQYEYKVVERNSVKIQPKNINTFREIRKKLDNLGAEYNTFQLKEDRKFRVAIRQLHPCTSPEAIAKEF
jgi:hypothetical protein